MNPPTSENKMWLLLGALITLNVLLLGGVISIIVLALSH